VFFRYGECSEAIQGGWIGLRRVDRPLALPCLMQWARYLTYSAERRQSIFPARNWRTLSFEQHEILTALRVPFSEFQEHLGKTMRAVAIDEEVPVERFGKALGFRDAASWPGVG
jgi:hypothetical protein